MAVRVIVVVLVLVFSMAAVGALLAEPVNTVSETINATGDYDNSWLDGNSVMIGLVQDWFNAILVGIFGVLVWGFWRVIKRELSRQGL
jgi:hypothetical protein